MLYRNIILRTIVSLEPQPYSRWLCNLQLRLPVPSSASSCLECQQPLHSGFTTAIDIQGHHGSNISSRLCHWLTRSCCQSLRSAFQVHQKRERGSKVSSQCVDGSLRCQCLSQPIAALSPGYSLDFYFARATSHGRAIGRYSVQLRPHLFRTRRDDGLSETGRSNAALETRSVASQGTGDICTDGPNAAV